MKQNQVNPNAPLLSFINEMFMKSKSKLRKFRLHILSKGRFLPFRRSTFLSQFSIWSKESTLWGYNSIASFTESASTLCERITLMNCKLILATIFIFSVSSCAKDPFDPNDDSSNEGKYLISFNIDGFSQDLIPFSDRIHAYGLSASADRNPFGSLSNTIQAAEIQNTDIRDFINTIEIKVYNGKSLVDSIRQYADNTDFGKFSKYYKSNNPHNVFIVGAMLENNGDIIMRKETSTTDIQNVYLKILPKATDAFTFFKSFDLTKEPKHENFKLKRFVGRVEVNLDEPIPSDADRIDITIENTAEYYLPFYQRGYYLNQIAILDTIPHHTNKSIQIKPEDVGRNDFSISAYFLLKSELGKASGTTKVILAAYRKDGTLIQKKEIPNVSLQANKRTKLIGKIFTVANIDFDIELEKDWNSDVPEYQF